MLEFNSQPGRNLLWESCLSCTHRQHQHTMAYSLFPHPSDFSLAFPMDYMILFVISLKVTIGWYLLHENVRGLIDLIGVLIRQTRNRSTTLPDKCCQLEDQHVRMWGEDWAPCIVAKQANSPIFLTHRPIPIYRYYISTDPYFIPMEGYS